MAESTKRYAVVTGANRGIGFEICKQLATKGITVVLTARDENKGLEAVEKLKQSVLSETVLFHQLDVTEHASVSSLADFIKTQFGRLDILVNNAGIGGVSADPDVVKASVLGKPGAQINWNEILIETNELAEECLETNYYGVKRVCEALLPLLHLSESPRIINVSASMGQLKNISNAWAKAVLDDAENLTEEKVETVLSIFLQDFKEGSLEAKGWPTLLATYSLSKAAMNAYARILTKKYPGFQINCVCPGSVKTDINYNTGLLTVEEGAQSAVRLALLPNDGPSAQFFVRMEPSEF
ncbi:Short-chain dehydrogenase/reductase SDR [Corchorus olitorius]|uniref:Short-chain dehydrogenase/reductase n=1 Tax=Corchorus olitorius TaxID=93759 RepID=A0A1R3K026_9ROSI|nr:Short-chain dehydrogenase/reductase SDR [Corchorus olitorius]